MNEQIKSIVKIAFIALVLCGIGLFVLNQYLAYRYKAVFLQSPCMVCQELNPQIAGCLTRRDALFYDPLSQSWVMNKSAQLNITNISVK
jgi:hypothetical protein